jgi:disulfide bond formation protein DsbB
MSSRLALAILLAGSVAVIGGALFSQYVGGLVPCELCLMERWPYYIGIPLTLAALAAGGRRGLVISGVALVLLLFLASSALAFYHVGVEQHWFQGPTACTGAGSAAHSVEALKAQLFAQQPVRCDEVQWSLFGVSLAGWNLAASLALSALALFAWRRA